MRLISFSKKISKQAFTLVEIMIVILISALLISMASLSFTRIRKRVRETSCQANMRIILDAAITAQTISSDTSKDLTLTNLLADGYLRKKPKCPSGGKYEILGEKDNLTVRCVGLPDGVEHGQISESELQK